MENTAVSSIRGLLVAVAYCFNGVIALMILGVTIWLLRKIPELSETWMPEYYNGKNRNQYRQCWQNMAPWEKKHARKQRLFTILIFSAMLITFLIGAYLIIRFFFPGIIEFAKNI